MTLKVATVITADASQFKSEVSGSKVAVQDLGTTAASAAAGVGTVDKALDSAAQAARANQAANTALATSQSALATSSAAAAQGTRQLDQTLDHTTRASREAAVAMGGLAGAQGALEGASAQLAAHLDRAAISADKFESSALAMVQVTANLEAALKQTAEAQARFNDQFGKKPANDNPTKPQVDGAEQLRAKYDDLYAIGLRYKDQVAEIRAAHADGKIGFHEMGAMIDRAGDAATRSQDAYLKMSGGLRDANGAVKLTSHQVTNLGYQVNDVATMLLMGASPFQIIASQGGQVVQALGDGPQGVRGSLTRFDRYAAREREEEIRAGGEAILDLERALAAERGQIVKQFADRAVEEAKQLADRTAEEMRSAIERYDDRAFAATNIDDLAAFEREIAREREEAVRLGGEALVAFERMAAAERANLIKAQTDELRTQRASAAQSRLDMTIRNRADAENDLRQAYERTVSFVGSIRSFLDSGRVDSQFSTLDAKGRFEEAQRQYRDTQAKADAGDTEAQDRLVQSAETYRQEARSYFATSEGYGEVYDEIERTLKATAAKADTELGLARQQASFLRDLVGGQQTLTETLGEYLRSVRDVMAAMGGVNEHRDWGSNESFNRQLVDSLAKQGLNYSGDFGKGGFGRWSTGLNRAEQEILSRVMAQLGGAGQPARNWGVNSAQNQAIDKALRSIGLDYNGDFGQGGLTKHLAGLSTADRDRARQALGFQSGGIIPAGVIRNGAWNVDSVFASIAGGGEAKLAGGEAIITAKGVNAQTLPFIEYINANHRLPNARVAANDGTSAATAAMARELSALRASHDALMRQLIALTGSKADATRDAIDRGNRSSEQASADARRANSLRPTRRAG